MADYIFIRKSRNALSNVLHVLLNVALGIGSIAVTVISGSWVLGVILVIISKWRVFAVRPRFWLPNLKANLVDFIVGLSFVLIAYCAGTEVLLIHYILAIGYVAWLVILKSRSSALAVEAQALLAVFLGTSAAALLAASLDPVVLAFAEFVIGYGAARHVISQNDDSKYTTLTLVAGIVAAELAWLCYQWLIIYTFGATGIIIPQLAIIMTVLAFLFGRTYRSISSRDGHLKLADLALPAAFSFILLAIVVLGFSQPIFNI